jgi:hypothetical protein
VTVFKELLFVVVDHVSILFLIKENHISHREFKKHLLRDGIPYLLHAARLSGSLGHPIIMVSVNCWLAVPAV